MIRYTDRRYYAEFDGRVTTYSATTRYFPGDIVQVSELYYEHSGIAAGTIGVAVTDTDTWTMIDELPQLGYYQFLSLEDIIDNFMVLYGEEESYVGMPNRNKIQAFANRAIQEFSYDTFRVKSFESEINDQYILPMPQDYVDFVSLHYVDRYGTENWLVERLDSGAPRSVVQDGESTDATGYTYDSQGRLIFDDLNSETIARLNGDASDFDGNATTERFNQRNPGATQRTYLEGERAISGYSGAYSTYGKRYWQDGQKANEHATYVIMPEDGVIYLEPSLSGEVVTLRYVSDGISSNPSEVTVHKFAEQAIYDHIYYEMVSRKNTVPANEKERAKRRMKAKRVEAKLRLSTFSHRQMIQLLRGQSNWIKT